MKIGFLTNVLRRIPFEEIAKWAIDNGFEFLEVGPHVPTDKTLFKKVMEDTGIHIIGLIFCRNFQERNEVVRKKLREELYRRIDLACDLGLEYMTISTGIDKSKSFEENLQLFKEFIIPILEKCEDHGVKIAIENCPDTGNIATSPYRWERIFKEIDSKNLGLCYDPSHLIRLLIDPYKPIREFAERIFYIHAKDTEIDHEKLSWMGIVERRGWWRYRLPGFGVIDWNRIILILKEIGFNGYISIEHEDRAWLQSIDRIKGGLLLSKNYLERLPSF
ncbi:MAG: sugar phosphate isomerase/epimerase [Thermoprotei archaeon]|nr:MAG: sugar phosphate isomerase/epimerase [Thermoprotei archaeon]